MGDDKNKANSEINCRYSKCLLAATVVLSILAKSFRLEVIILSEYDIQDRNFVYLLKLLSIIKHRNKQVKHHGIQHVLNTSLGEKYHNHN